MGGSGGGANLEEGSPGGGGGGAILLASNTKVTISSAGAIELGGGLGFIDPGDDGRGGSGGSGTIRIVAPEVGVFRAINSSRARG